MFYILPDDPQRPNSMGGSAVTMTPLRAGDPDRLGQYALVGRLGAGGMGTVFVGTGPDGQKVAVKAIRPEWSADPAFLARFRSEVKRAREVPPFCTAAVLDADVEHDPPYLVVEFVDGPSLADVVRDRGPLNPSEVYGVAVGVATALLAIHGAGVVHRDLKPANVLLAVGLPKVIDFGIARGAELSAELTGPDQIMGTVGYVAPESLDGSGKAGPAADVFAWGVLIGYAATGHTPFRGDSPMATIGRMLTQPPDLDGIPDSLRDLVATTLEKDPAGRPTARELLDSLLSMGTTDVSSNVTPELREAALAARARSRLRRWPRRALTAAVVAVLLGGAGFAALQARADADRASDQARQQERELVQQDLLARSAAALTADPGLASRLAVSAYGMDRSARSGAAVMAALATGYAGELTTGSPVVSAAFRPDGRLVAIGGEDTAELWAGSARTAALPSGLGNVNELAFSPDGRTLAVAADRLTLWNVANPAAPRLLTSRDLGPAVTDVRFTADGRRLFTVADRATLWDIRDRYGPRALWSSSATTMSADGTVLAGTGDDGRLTIWSASGTRTGTGVSTGLPVALTANGRLLAVQDDEKAIHFYDLTDPAEPQRRGTITISGDRLSTTEFDPSGTAIALGRIDGTVEVWNVADPDSPVQTKTMTRTGGWITSIDFSPDGARILTPGPRLTKAAMLWRIDGFAPRRRATLKAGTVIPSRTVSVSAEDVVAAGSAEHLDYWDVIDAGNPQPAGTATLLPAAGEPLVDSTYAVHGTTFYYTSGSLYSLTGARPRNVFPDLAAGSVLDLDPVRGLVAVLAGGPREQIRIHRLAGEQTPPLVAAIPAANVFTARFGLAGGTLAVGDSAGQQSGSSNVTVWDLVDPAAPTKTGTFAVNSVGPAALVAGPAFTVTVGQDLSVWNNRDGADRSVRTARRTDFGRPDSLALSVDGSLLAVTSGGSTEIWSVGFASDPVLLAVVGGRTTGSAFSSRQPLLVTADPAGVALWDLVPIRAVLRDPLPAACEQTDGLTAAEWAAYAPGLTFERPCP
ncbi:WD40 repeat domain-containing serine/threonine protein kinase [Actinoplanes subglobosus]|uniref:WD40 repeat domain-containing serine/threonine protein kinase n=1 Tax=Actinoplanes subglobosus TaxID=1547892 RepID=A0ABV8IJ93_9ACTN